MLTLTLAHAGQPPAPHDVWGAWNADPLLVTGLLVAGWVYWRGYRGGTRRPAERRRARCFAAALVALGVALVSPLDAVSDALASAHMVQHVLLVLVAAPLLALSGPSGTLLRGSPSAVRPTLGRLRRRLHRTLRAVPALGHPLTVWLLHAGVLWLWHAAVLYDAAVEHRVVHAAEHATFLLTGLLFWGLVAGRASRARLPGGLGILLVFAMALQGTFLAVLLTFARGPWYAAYAETTAAWGLQPLADQQLAGAIMWVPAGFVYLGAGLGLLAAWLRASAREDAAVAVVPRAVTVPRVDRGTPG